MLQKRQASDVEENILLAAENLSDKDLTDFANFVKEYRVKAQSNNPIVESAKVARREFEQAVRRSNGKDPERI